MLAPGTTPAQSGAETDSPEANPQAEGPVSPTNETTDFELALSREGRDLFRLHARRSSTFGTSYTDLEVVTLEVPQGPIPGLVIRAEHGRYTPSTGDFTLEGSIVAGLPDRVEAHFEHLVFSAADGLAVSDDPIVIRGRNLTGESIGLEISPSEERLSLLSEVRLHYQKGGRRSREGTLECGRLDYWLSPPRLECEQGVRASEPRRRLESDRLRVDLRESDRRPLKARAEGNARLSLQVAPAEGNGPDPLAMGFPSGSNVAMEGEVVDLLFDPERRRLRQATAPERGSLVMRPMDGSDSERILDAGRLELSFRPGAKPGRTLPKALTASNGVQLRWRGPDGSGELRSETLTARWSEDANRIEEAHLEGGWQLEQPDLVGRGDEADVNDEWIELRGGPDSLAMIDRGGRLLAGFRLRLPRGEGHWHGEGGVQARRSTSARESSWSPLGAEGEFWVSARRFQVDPETWNWRFEEQVRAWQGSNLIESDRLDVNEAERSLQALGNVTTRGVSSSDTTEGGGTHLVWVRAARLRYTEGGRLAEYRGGVELIHDTSYLEAAELDVYLADQGSGIDRVLARGDVHTVYADVLGEAQRAEYRPAERYLRLWTPGGSARARRRDGSEALNGQELSFGGSSGRITVKSGTRGRSWIVLEDSP